MKLDRRQMLVAGSAALLAPRIAFARAATDRKLIFIIQRGAADGLATLAPTGDPAYSSLRGDLVADSAAGTRLDGMFTLHPALKSLAGLYGSKQALFAHAVASPYRDRSHFDGQNVLETGASAPYERKDGWLNRLLPMLPDSRAKALAISTTIPAALRGPAEVSSYAPSNLPGAADDLQQRVSMLYAGDAQLHGLWETALQTRAMAGDTGSSGAKGGAAIGQLVASLMTGKEGAGVVMVETTGWDTHAGQRGRLATQLGALDDLIGALRDGLGPQWGDTLVLVATEFGRTAAANGTGGTDHGTASLAMLCGGSVNGGRILADWPGLSAANLYEGRDLKPTNATDALLAGAIAEHFALDPALAASKLFPGSSARPISGLIRS